MKLVPSTALFKRQKQTEKNTADRITDIYQKLQSHPNCYEKLLYNHALFNDTHYKKDRIDRHRGRV